MMFDARHNTSKVWDPEQVWDIVVRQIVFLERKAFHSRIVTACYGERFRQFYRRSTRPVVIELEQRRVNTQAVGYAESSCDFRDTLLPRVIGSCLGRCAIKLNS
jgi:hypothetical protein